MPVIATPLLTPGQPLATPPQAPILITPLLSLSLPLPLRRYYVFADTL
jgi:hypothetical protein